MPERNSDNPVYSPIIVGGVGGSGTRVVAKILEESGVFLGNHLNVMKDNLLFLVLESPSRVQWPYERLRPFIELFEKLHFGKSLRPMDWLRLILWKPVRYHQNVYKRNLRYALFSKRMPQKRPWGWKNGPNHFYLTQLRQHYPHCFYIHTIRHGLDMAFSKNRRQLKLYGHLLGVESNVPEGLIPAQQLEYWIKSNNHVINYCKKNLPNRYFILRFDELCASPEKVIAEMFDALRFKPDVSATELGTLVEPPDSLGRYRSENQDLFTREQLSAVEALGFKVEA